MKQYQVILLLIIIPIVIIAATFALAIMTTMPNGVLAQTGNNSDTEINEYQFITKWGSLGTEPGQFDGQNSELSL